MREGTFYFSDTHLGAGPENFDLVQRSFDALQRFYWKHYMQITKAVDLGDYTENWLTAKEFGNPYESGEIITATREIYKKLFDGRQPHVLACAGNHQTEILNSDSTPEEAMDRSEKATDELEGFLSRVFEDSPDAELEVFRGVKQIKDGVFAHHGDFLSKKPGNRLREIMGQFDENTSLRDKIDLINSDAEMYGKMQGVWQNFRRFLWPALALTNDSVRSVGFRLFSDLTKRQGIPFHSETSLNFDLLNSLSDNPKESAIVSGHFHVPNIVSDTDKGTVVNLGAWHDTHKNPAIAINTKRNGKNIFLLSEFEPTTNKWNISDERVIGN